MAKKLTVVVSQGQSANPAKRKLEAGDESPVKTLILNSETSFAEVEEDLKKSPELIWRVFTMTKPEGFFTTKADNILHTVREISFHYVPLKVIHSNRFIML